MRCYHMLAYFGTPKWSKNEATNAENATQTCIRILTHLITHKWEEHETNIMEKHKKRLGNIVPDENHHFYNVERNVTNTTSTIIKNHVKKSHKSSTNVSTKRQDTMISREPPTSSQNCHKMVTEYHKNHQQNASSHQTKKWSRVACRRFSKTHEKRGGMGLPNIKGREPPHRP